MGTSGVSTGDGKNSATRGSPMSTTEPAGPAHYVHKGCEGVTIWDLSGGFCVKCHAEGLDADDVERRETAP